MCNLREGVFEKGVQKGIEKGRLEGRLEGEISFLKTLMQSMNLTAEEAMNALKIPDEDRPKYLQMLKASI